MPFNAEQISYGGKAAIDYYLKNDPIDNVNVDRPLIKTFMSKKKPYGGGLQFVVEQLRKDNDSNFQAYFGDGQVTYNRKRTLEQVKYKWGSFHDGFGLNEDELTQNGIVMTDDKNAVASDAEKVQLTNLLKENMETLKLGFQEKFDIMLHRDGTQDADEIAGLDHLISTTPTTGTVGGLDVSTTANSFFRNYASLDIAASTAGTLVDEMETAWRRCIRVGGSPPDLIVCGSDFLDAYRSDATAAVNRQLMVKGAAGTNIDAGINGTFFKGVPLTWDPVFETLDTLDSPTEEWEKRCYFINTRYISLRPIKGHWLVPRKPPRVYDRYVHYFGLTAKAAFTTCKRNAHAVLHIN